MKISFTDTYVERETVLNDRMNVDYRDIRSFLVALGQRAPLDTGLLPPGLLSYRQAGQHTQIVLCCEPAANLVCWGAHEGDRDAGTFTLAQPYRIVIGETNKGQMLGARIFYSPVPITRGDQVLYHQNVPNINCKGYRGTGVGWVCLYHTEDWKDCSLAERAVRLGLRASGNEAYNDGNMSGTDGPRFYAAEYERRYQHKAKDFTYLWNPKAWEKKSEKEGFAWTLNEALWIPVLVNGIDDQTQHNPDGVPLTLDMAMNGGAHFYYQDTDIKDFHHFVRNDLELAPDVVGWATAAYAEAAPTVPPEVIPMSADVLANFGEDATVLPTIEEFAHVLPGIDGQGLLVGDKKK